MRHKGPPEPHILGVIFCFTLCHTAIMSLLYRNESNIRNLYHPDNDIYFTAWYGGTPLMRSLQPTAWLQAAQELRRSKHIDALMIRRNSHLTTCDRRVVAGIIQTFEFLRARQRASSITELLHTVMLCGGGALQPGIDQLLSEETGLPITVAKPLSGRPGADRLGEDILALEPMFTGALGLALQGVDEV